MKLLLIGLIFMINNIVMNVSYDKCIYPLRYLFFLCAGEDKIRITSEYVGIGLISGVKMDTVREMLRKKNIFPLFAGSGIFEVRVKREYAEKSKNIIKYKLLKLKNTKVSSPKSKT